jgi:hypothetical protein
MRRDALQGAVVSAERLRGAVARRGRLRSAADTRESGQATVEVVALLPLLLIAGLAAAALLAAHSAGEEAGQAAEAGAVALLQGADAEAAARRALPAAARQRADITVHDRRVTVTLRPHLPLAALERPLTARETAHAGPEATP